MKVCLVRAMVMVSSEGFTMSRLIADIQNDHLAEAGAVQRHVSVAPALRVKFYPGLGWAPCIQNDLQELRCHLSPN